MRRWPARLMFFCNKMPAVGGRIFVHSAKQVEQMLLSDPSGVGPQLVEKLAKFGMTLEFGYLDQGAFFFPSFACFAGLCCRETE